MGYGLDEESCGNCSYWKRPKGYVKNSAWAKCKKDDTDKHITDSCEARRQYIWRKRVITNKGDVNGR
jgi:hypothetical protein